MYWSSTLGIPKQNPASKHFKMGIKHILSPFTIWNTFSDMGRYIIELALYHVFKVWFADVHRFHDVFRQSFLISGRFWRGHLIMKTQVKTSTKRLYVEEKWPNHGTRVKWEYKSSISWTYQGSGDFRRQAFSPFWCMSSHLFSATCCLGKPKSAARDVIWIASGNSMTIGGNVSARATTKPSTIKWFHFVPPVSFDSDENGKLGR